MASTLFTVGRILLAVAMISLGLEHVVTGNFPVALFPVPVGFPGRYVVVMMMGVTLIVAGFCIGFRRKADVAALVLGVLFLVLTLCLHVPLLVRDVHNGGAWTVFAELLAFSGGFFCIAGLISSSSIAPKSRFTLIVVGKFLFVSSLVIFGILHFVYADYIATLIPSWIPAPLFWAYFVGVAFFGTAISLLVNWQRTLATGLLGLMFLLWVVLLHAPRVIKKTHAEPEWTSLLVALTMSGIAFTIASSRIQNEETMHTDTLPEHARLL